MRRQCKPAPIKAASRIARRTVSGVAGNLFTISIGLSRADFFEELAPGSLVGVVLFRSRGRSMCFICDVPYRASPRKRGPISDHVPPSSFDWVGLLVRLAPLGPL